MPDIIISATTIERMYPTENDVSNIAQDGLVGTEDNVAINQAVQNPRDGVLPDLVSGVPQATTEGFELAFTPSSLAIQIKRGRAYIQGFFINQLSGVTMDTTVDAAPAGQELINHIYLKLRKTSGIIDGSFPLGIDVVPVAPGTAPVQPANSIKINEVTTDDTEIISIRDTRPSMMHIPVYFDAMVEGETGSSEIFSRYVRVACPATGNDEAKTFSCVVGLATRFPTASGGADTLVAEIKLYLQTPSGETSTTISNITIPSTPPNNQNRCKVQVPISVSFDSVTKNTRFIGNMVELRISVKTTTTFGIAFPVAGTRPTVGAEPSLNQSDNEGMRDGDDTPPIAADSRATGVWKDWNAPN